MISLKKIKWIFQKRNVLMKSQKSIYIWETNSLEFQIYKDIMFSQRIKQNSSSDKQETKFWYILYNTQYITSNYNLTLNNSLSDVWRLYIANLGFVEQRDLPSNYQLYVWHFVTSPSNKLKMQWKSKFFKNKDFIILCTKILFGQLKIHKVLHIN